MRHSIEAGVGLVMFSGDKLLGGPQAGIIAGKKDLVQRVRRHPLFRALRVDKLTIAALEVTLNAYLRSAWEEIPAQRMIRLTTEELQQRAENFLRQVRSLLQSADAKMEIADGFSAGRRRFHTRPISALKNYSRIQRQICHRQIGATPAPPGTRSLRYYPRGRKPRDPGFTHCIPRAGAATRGVPRCRALLKVPKTLAPKTFHAGLHG